MLAPVLRDLLNTLMDDKQINCRSIIWFPNHYEPLDYYSGKILSLFTHIITLAPGSVDIINFLQNK